MRFETARYILSYGTEPQLKHFSRQEFGIWWPFMSKDLLVLLDALRDHWGHPIEISPAPGAIGRTKGSSSQHDLLGQGCVRAVDVLPFPVLDGPKRKSFYELAKAIGFTGIGLYPRWSPRAGAHLDVRPDRSPLDPATWSGWPSKAGPGQSYKAIELAW